VDRLAGLDRLSGVDGVIALADVGARVGTDGPTTSSLILPTRGTRVDTPAAAQNIGYADHLVHDDWHDIDLPFSTDETPVVDRPPRPGLPNERSSGCCCPERRPSRLRRPP
jgi:hypothetical protein